jgi:hypothetical protein
MITEFNWPFCEKCGHGVERIKREIDVFTGDVIYTVTCHGKHMVQVVSGLDLHDVVMMHTTSHYDEKPTDAYPSVTYMRAS